MTNANHDIPDAQIKLPARMPNTTHDILEIERRQASTQNKELNQNMTTKQN